MRGSVCSYFEGTEKKLELTVDPSAAALRSLGDAFWHGVVRRAGADVLSKLSNHHCDAYLLSESSLFVFEHRAAMMTCGRTTLHDAVLAVLERIPAEHVRAFVYKRKHEVFPHDQPTSFFDDIRVLNEHLPGRAYQFGNRDEHYLDLFCMSRDETDGPHGTTAEVLMHGLGESVRRDFSVAVRSTTDEVRIATGVDRIIPGFDVDDHLFEGNGYSLNAIREDEYYAVHVTPEHGCSYGSFETNCRFAGNLGSVLARLLGIFRPRSLDLILDSRLADEHVTVPGYRLKSQVAQAPGQLPGVRFLSYDRPQRAVARAVELQVR